MSYRESFMAFLNNEKNVSNVNLHFSVNGFISNRSLEMILKKQICNNLKELF